mmetsp:Transcript_11119/g.28278  ORF Transcript_11119/g.28278 Transcript_11119/m.28278 type:complete len:248 (+) Transcript_11119:121-864(+)
MGGDSGAKKVAAKLPEYKPIKTVLGVEEDVDSSSWSTLDVANWLQSCGLGNYAMAFAQHKITGDLLHVLTEQHLRELGVESIGERLLIMHQIAKIYRGAVQRRRFRTIWEAEALMYTGGITDWCCKVLSCYSCCNDPDHYKLTGATLYVSELDKKRHRGICCQTSKYTRAIDLSTIAGVNDYHRNALCDCCCAADVVNVDLDKEKGLEEVPPLYVPKGKGHKIALMIQAATEEAQSLAPGQQHMVRM